jgi:hypothetical protein
MERSTALALLGASAFVSAALVVGALWLVRSRASSAQEPTAPTPPSPDETLAVQSPTKAWAFHEMRRSLVDQRQDVDPAERERLAKDWDREIRAGLLEWTPKTPEDRLAVARFAHAAGFADRAMKELAVLASDTGPAGREAAGIEMTLRLQAHDPEGARVVLDRLRRHLPPEELPTVEGALFEEAAATARARVEGASPDLAAAKRALEIAVELAREPEDIERVALARAYVGLLDDPLAWRTHLSDASFPPAGPQIVVLSDDFALGEAVLPSVVKRWVATGIPVSLVARSTGEIREGIRREPTLPITESRRFGKRAMDMGVPLAATIVAGSPADRAVGLTGAGAAVIVVDAEGRAVALASGPTLDPRPLDPVVARLR